MQLTVIRNADFTAQPTTSYSGQSLTHEVELPDADSVVSIELQCDIQPGALRKRYSIQWIATFPNTSFVFEKDIFDLSLIVRSSLNGSQYHCEVTIDHDGNGVTMTYKGRIVTIHVMIDMIIIPEGIYNNYTRISTFIILR